MSTIPELQYELLKLPMRIMYLKISIYDTSLNFIKEISGNLIGGSMTCDANSDLRKTFSVELVVTEDDLKPFDESDIWIDKYVQFTPYLIDYRQDVQYTGFPHGYPVPYSQGYGVVDAPSWKYDAKNNILSFTAIDLVSKLNGTRGGYLPGIPVTISEEENVKTSIEAIFTEFAPGTSTDISECYNRNHDYIQPVPYDLDFSQGSTIWDLLVKLRDILPNYQMYFDNTNTFIYKEIPYEADPTPVITDDLWNEIVISENTDLDFSNLHNSVEVYGQTQDLTTFKGGYKGEAESYTIETTTDSVGNTIQYYQVTFSGWPDTTSAQQTACDSGTLGCFTLTLNANDPLLSVPYFKVNNGAMKLLVDNRLTQGVLHADFPLAGKTYVIQMINLTGAGIYLYYTTGMVQYYAEAKETNTDSPFAISKIGEIRKVYFDGDYANINSYDLCKQRADWELYQSCRVPDKITLVTLPNYLLEVNTVVSYTSKQTGETNLYLVQSFNTDWNAEGTTNVTLQRYYPYYNT